MATKSENNPPKKLGLEFSKIKLWQAISGCSINIAASTNRRQRIRQPESRRSHATERDRHLPTVE
ncbi:hypothetical protein Hanom_Chr12g01129741 [Helianthus anomalus]